MPLTPRQREVVALLAAGHAYPEIGRRLGIATRTVRQHIDDVATDLPAAGCGHPKCRVLLAAPTLLADIAA